MRKTFYIVGCCLLFMLAACTSNSSSIPYESVPDDPMKARIYTLDNGLKVYLTVNKETPRIQTYIAVRVGGKNDPKETTGLAHYFEHLMFKGTNHFGTVDYEKEEPLLNQIEDLFEVYRQTTDEASRKALYHQIDSISYEASKYAIPNEYDKLMATIGANGTNAYTGFDQTVYVEDIPSNEVENWAKIESDRFQNAVIRGFHTELETVYEEKNMSLTKDGRKISEAILASLYPDYPYGTQTVLGTQEHLKNPSLKKIKEYYDTWYVPNNMAICMSGDLDPEKTIAIIQKYFGSMKANPSLPARPEPKENPLTAPVVKDVIGLDAENVALAWRVPSDTKSDLMLTLVDEVMNNGKAGLLDVDLLQSQRILYGYSSNLGLADYNTFLVAGAPKQGQTLEEVKDLFLEEIAKLKRGDFSDDIMQAALNNYKLDYMQMLEDNSSRADMFVEAFIGGDDWADVVAQRDEMSKVTKQQLVDFANQYFGDNYALIYKRHGKDPNEKKMDKPEITPIVMNRDSSSLFLREMQKSAAAVTPIEPVFLDFKKDMQQFTAKSDIPVLYKENTTNDVFSLMYVFEMGTGNDKALDVACDYLTYLGTSKKSLQEINLEFYKLACSFSVVPGTDRTYVTLSGLSENMAAAIQLFEELLADAQVNKNAYANLTNDILKGRADSKLNQSANFNRLLQYAVWGPDSPTTHILSSEELQQMNPQTLVDRIHDLGNYEHKILYYGPMKQKELLTVINQYHQVPETLSPVPSAVDFKMQETNESKVYFAQYDAKQIYFSAISNRGEKFDAAVQPILTMYNEYFGGGMNSIVFQEMREARALAYSAAAAFVSPSKLKYPYYYRTFIATQNDKMLDAMKAFDEIVNNMPESERAFELAKESLITRMRTDRITKSDILWAYLNAQDLGLTVDSRKTLFEQVQKFTLEDVKAFQEKWIKGRKYVYVVLGDEKDLDMKGLGQYGPVQKLSKEEIFGY